MTTAVSRKRGRTPLDDAPPYDPVQWSAADLSFIESFSRRTAEEQLRRRADEDISAEPVFTGVSPPSSGTPGSESTTGFHTLPLFRPQSVFARLFHYFFPDWYRRYQGNLSDSALRGLPDGELLTLMQLAFASGERDRAALIGRELSRRRLRIGVAVNNNTTAASTAGTATLPPDQFAPNGTGLYGGHPDDDQALLWVAGGGGDVAPSHSPPLSFAGSARHRDSGERSSRRKIARYEGADGGLKSARTASAFSWWWPFSRRRERHDRSDDDNEHPQPHRRTWGSRAEASLRAGASTRRAPDVAPEPPRFLAPDADTVHRDTSAAPPHPLSVDDVLAEDMTTRSSAHPLDPGPFVPSFLSEAVPTSAFGGAPGPRGQLRPSRAIALEAGNAPTWRTHRPPLARHSGEATATWKRGEADSAAQEPLRHAPSATSTSADPTNNWWNVKNGRAAEPLDGA